MTTSNNLHIPDIILFERYKLVVTVQLAHFIQPAQHLPGHRSRRAVSWTVTLPSHLQFRKQSDKNLILQLNEDIDFKRSN